MLHAPGFHKSPPPSRPPRTPCKIPKDSPLLVWECIGVHSTMERFAGANFGGQVLGGFGGGSGRQFMKTRGFLTWGFAISEKSPIG